MLRCELPGLLGNGVDVRRDLNLSGSTVTGALTTTASQSRSAAIWLCESQVGGRLLCVDTVIEPGDGRAIQADRMKVGGTVRLIHDFTAARRGAAARRPDRRVDQPHRRPPRRRGRRGPGPGRRRHRRQPLPDRAAGRAGPAGRRPDRAQLRPGGRPGHRRRRDGHRVRPGPRAATTRTRRAGIRHQRLPAVGGRRPHLRGPLPLRGRVDLPLATLGRLTAGPDCRFDAPGNTALDLTNAELASHLRLARGSPRARHAPAHRGDDPRHADAHGATPQRPGAAAPASPPSRRPSTATSTCTACPPRAARSTSERPPSAARCTPATPRCTTPRRSP